MAVQRGKAKTTAGTATKSADRAPEDMRDRIARRAYELYERRGYQHGNDLGDWFQAEAEITGGVISMRAAR